MPTRRVCLVGAGYIAHVHAEALRQLPGIELVSVVDASRGAAETFARRWRLASYGSVEEMLAADKPDRAHVLVPPDRHAAVARSLIDAGVTVLIEKPMAASAAECRTLLDATAASGAVVGVNQNFVHHPAFRRLQDRIAGGGLGPLRAIDCIFNAPLRQMAARQFGHWMFHEPKNILLEQAVHPLSQIFALAGIPEETAILAEPPLEIAAGVPFHPVAAISLRCRDGVQAQMRFAVGQEFPFWQVTAICDDGVIVADMYADRVHAFTRTAWPDFADTAAAGLRAAAAIAGDSLGYSANYLMSLVKLKRRSDPFFRSMAAAIADFHRAVDAGRPPTADGAFGAALVQCCEDLAAKAFAMPAPAVAAPVTGGAAYDVAVLGGTGFIGRHVVARLLADGLTVGVMARNTRNLPAVFAAPGVTLVQGDIRKPEDVARAIGSARYVVNLAHGGGGASFAEIKAAMVGSAELVAEACLAKGVRRLVHVGSIAALYLGDAAETITGATPSDAKAAQRGDYARAKAIADDLLLRLHAERGLPVTILRPGVVVGEGGIAFHGGLGFYNNDQHCIGWNAGRNPLPFVLVTDVADAVAKALRAEAAIGRAYNLAGDVRLTAREYVAELAHALRRPLRFHPQSASVLWASEAAKWLVKRSLGRGGPMPTLRDLRSRGMVAAFDCGDAKRDLGWQPVAERAVFVRSAIHVHAPMASEARP